MLTPAERDRRIVPQWRSFLATSVADELAMPAKNSSSAKAVKYINDIARRAERFRVQPDLASAAELLETAVISNQYKEAVPAARVILRSDCAVPLLRRQAERIIQLTGHGEEFQLSFEDKILNDVSSWRARTKINPLDAIAWLELSLAQFSRGHHSSAKRSMSVAFQLAPSNRHVLRAAARFYFHLNDFEKAYELIRRSDSTPGDPWLMAAEVALSFYAEKKPVFLKRGIELVVSESSHPNQITELAGAVGTQILLDGSIRLGRKLMRRSQLAPTANALAQAEWVSLKFGEPPEQIFLKGAWEAQAMRAFFIDASFDRAILFAENWIEDEPYNPISYSMAAFFANILERYDTSLNLSQRGLSVAKGFAPLLNAMAFASARAGKLDIAEKALNKIDADINSDDGLISLANRGLIALRRGRSEEGKLHYDSAISGFRLSGNSDLEASALAHCALELAQARDIEGAQKYLLAARQLKHRKLSGRVLGVRNYIDLLLDRAEKSIQAATANQSDLMKS